MKKFKVLILLVTVLFGTISCKKQKEITQPSLTSYSDEKSRVETTLSLQPTFTSFQSKINVSINLGGKSVSSNGVMKLISGEKIQISMQPFLGIEMFRFQISNDSIRILDRINRRYVDEDIRKYSELLPIDLSIGFAESLFMNRIFTLNHPQFSMKDFKEFSWHTENNGVLLGRLKKDQLVSLQFSIDRNNNLSQTFVSDKSASHRVEWNYAQFQPLNQSSFPMRSQITYASDKKNIQVDLTYSRIELDKPLNMSFDIPSSYKKMNLSDLVKGLLQ